MGYQQPWVSLILDFLSKLFMHFCHGDLSKCKLYCGFPSIKYKHLHICFSLPADVYSLCFSHPELLTLLKCIIAHISHVQFSAIDSNPLHPYCILSEKFIIFLLDQHNCFLLWRLSATSFSTLEKPPILIYAFNQPLCQLITLHYNSFFYSSLIVSQELLGLV